MGEQYSQFTRKPAFRFRKPKRIASKWRGEAFPAAKAQRETRAPAIGKNQVSRIRRPTAKAAKTRNTRDVDAPRFTANIVCVSRISDQARIPRASNVTSHRVVNRPRSTQFPYSIRARSSKVRTRESSSVHR